MTDRPAFSPAQLATRWGVSPGLVYRLLNSGEIEGFKVGGAWRVSANEVARVERKPAREPVSNGQGPLTNPWDQP